VLRTGGDTGHMGLIEKVQGSMLTTIEGNNEPERLSRRSWGLPHTGRTITSINLGFLDYA